MRLTNIFVQHDTVTDSEHTIHTIYHQQHYSPIVSALQNIRTQEIEQNKCDGDTTHITGKAFCPGTEVKQTEYQHTQQNHNNKIVIGVFILHIQDQQGNQYRQ